MFNVIWAVPQTKSQRTLFITTLLPNGVRHGHVSRAMASHSSQVVIIKGFSDEKTMRAGTDIR